MKIILIHNDVSFRETFKRNISHEYSVIMSSEVTAEILNLLVTIKKALVIIQWSLLRESTSNFVASLRRNEEFQIWVVSGSFTGDGDPVVWEMIQAGADKAFCTTEIWRVLKEEGLS